MIKRHDKTTYSSAVESCGGRFAARSLASGEQASLCRYRGTSVSRTCSNFALDSKLIGCAKDNESDASVEETFLTADILIDVIRGGKQCVINNINEGGSSLLVLCMLAHLHDLLGHLHWNEATC